MKTTLFPRGSHHALFFLKRREILLDAAIVLVGGTFVTVLLSAALVGLALSPKPRYGED